MIEEEARVEKEREIIRINEEAGRRIPPESLLEKEKINENNKRTSNRGEPTLRSKFGA